jgi:TolB-like protein/tetratricopeptide (TPR) repeat protein
MATDEYDGLAVRRELEQILASPAFSRSERQSRFLRFLVERHLEARDSELKESVIAVEVFDRKPDYDPKLDAIVRTEAVRLRARLSKYYANEGSGDAVVIDLPKGGYRPVFRQLSAVCAERKTRAARVWLTVGALVILALATAAISWRWAWQRTVPFTIAVLPLENLGHDPASDYFADGLTDEIIRNLSVIDGLTVRSRTSSFALKGKQLNVRGAGEQLGAEYILEGSVLRAGDQLRINAQLVRVRDDFPLWSGRFDRELMDVFAIQDEISRSIVNGLRLKLSHGRRLYETNLEAYDLYLRGRHAMDGFPARGRPIAKGAVQYFEEAVGKDPNYAIAYAGEADALLAIDENIVAPDAYTRAKAAAEKAVELDPMLSEAQSAVASIRARDYAWQDAERGFRRALELNPNNALAHLKLGISVLVEQGRFDEGLGEVRRAAALDPLSPYTNTEFARALRLAGRYKEAIDQARKAIALDPGRNRPYALMADALYLEGKTTEALDVFQDSIRRGANPDGFRPTWLACADVRTGRRDEALGLLDQTLRAAHPGATPAGRLAEIYACLGDKEHAFQYLEKAFAEHQAGLAEILQDPELAWMRQDPRFATLRKELNLAP